MCESVSVCVYVCVCCASKRAGSLMMSMRSARRSSAWQGQCMCVRVGVWGNVCERSATKRAGSFDVVNEECPPLVSLAGTVCV